ncbi:Ycf51 family protein [Phormidesmis sp. 146-12]
MFETQQLITGTQWAGILTIALAVLTVMAFLFKWGIRFRLVGITGFMGVLTAGIFGLSLGLHARPSIPGAVHYSRIYDQSADVVVIAVPPTVTEPQLEATLRQASADLYSPGRLSQGADRLLIRARTILHPREGLSQPLFIGEIQRSLSVRDDDQATIKIYRKNLAQLPQAKA